MMTTIIGVFDDRRDVESAIDKLHDEGFKPKDFSIVMKDTTERKELGDDTGANVTDSTLSGAGTGAVVGGITGLLAGTLLPGLGGFLIGGPIGAALGLTGAAAATVSGAATGAVVGGLLGALMGLGLNENEAKHYEQRINEGAIFVAVPADKTDGNLIVGIFDEFNAQDVRTLTHDDVDERTTTRTHRDTGSHHYALSTKGGRSSHRRPRRI